MWWEQSILQLGLLDGNIRCFLATVVSHEQNQAHQVYWKTACHSIFRYNDVPWLPRLVYPDCHTGVNKSPFTQSVKSFCLSSPDASTPWRLVLWVRINFNVSKPHTEPLVQVDYFDHRKHLNHLSLVLTEFTFFTIYWQFRTVIQKTRQNLRYFTSEQLILNFGDHIRAGFSVTVEFVGK